MPVKEQRSCWASQLPLRESDKLNRSCSSCVRNPWSSSRPMAGIASGDARGALLLCEPFSVHNLAWPHIHRRARAFLMIAVIVGASGSSGGSVVQDPEPARAAHRDWRSRSDGGAPATGEWKTRLVWRVDDGGASLRHPGDSTDQRASEDEPSVANVPAAHSQLLAAEHQHRHRHAGRAAIPAVARQAR